MACTAQARILGRCPEAPRVLPSLPRGALRGAVVALAFLVGVPQGACLAKDHLAASMGVPVEPFTLGQLIELRGAVENGAPVKAEAIMTEVGLGDVSPVLAVAGG